MNLKEELKKLRNKLLENQAKETKVSDRTTIEKHDNIAEVKKY